MSQATGTRNSHVHHGRPVVSVIIPTYNREAEVQAAIDSALGQTYPAVEVIVVDDGSTDGTRDVIEARYGNDPRVRYFHKANGGVSSARNLGLEVFTGAYVCLLDSDDTWEPWKVAMQVSCFEACPEVGMLWSDMIAVNPEGDVIRERYLREMYHGFRHATEEEIFATSFRVADLVPDQMEFVGEARLYVGDIYSHMAVGSLVHTSTTMIRTDRARAVGGFAEDMPIGEDHDFHLRTCRLGPVALMDVSTIRYRVGAEDQATAPENNHALNLALARNYLSTMSIVLAEDRDRIDLPRSAIESAFARGHEWYGECLMRAGHSARARLHLTRSLKRAPHRRRVWGLWLMTWVPKAARPLLRRVARMISGILALPVLLLACGNEGTEPEREPTPGANYALRFWLEQQ